MAQKRRLTLADEIKQTRPFASAAQEATLALLRTSNMIRRRIAKLVEREQITVQQYNVLRILRGAHAPLPALEIQDRLVEETPGVSRLIDRLVAKGLVRRDRSATDRRLLECSITRGGLRILERLDADMNRADAGVLSALTASEIAMLNELFSRVRESNR